MGQNLMRQYLSKISRLKKRCQKLNFLKEEKGKGVLTSNSEEDPLFTTGKDVQIEIIPTHTNAKQWPAEQREEHGFAMQTVKKEEISDAVKCLKESGKLWSTMREITLADEFKIKTKLPTPNHKINALRVYWPDLPNCLLDDSSYVKSARSFLDAALLRPFRHTGCRSTP